MFQTGFLTGVFRCAVGAVSPWRTVTNHTLAVRSSLVVTAGRVCTQMHGVRWGRLISETLCFDSNLVSRPMKNQLLAMSRIKPKICLLWFRDRFQCCLQKTDPGSNDFSQWNPCFTADGRAAALASAHRHGLQLCSPCFYFSCKIWLFLRYPE